MVLWIYLICGSLGFIEICRSKRLNYLQTQASQWSKKLKNMGIIVPPNFNIHTMRKLLFPLSFSNCWLCGLKQSINNEQGFGLFKTEGMRKTKQSKVCIQVSLWWDRLMKYPMTDMQQLLCVWPLWPLWISKLKLAPHLLWTLQFLDLPLSSCRGIMDSCKYTIYDLWFYLGFYYKAPI